MLTSALGKLTHPLIEIHSHLKNVYDSLTLFENNNFASYIFIIKKNRLHQVIKSLIIKLQKEAVITILPEQQAHYFNAFHNLCCKKLGFLSIEDYYAPKNLSEELKNTVYEEVHGVTDDFVILKEVMEEYSNRLESILKKHNIPLNSPFPREEILPHIITEINEKICEDLNILLKITKKDRLDFMSFIELENQESPNFSFSRSREFLMSKLTSMNFKSNLDSKVFAILPSKNKKLCIGSINDSFFWCFKGNLSARKGKTCVFDKYDSMPLNLSHLKSIDFNSWSSNSISNALLTQALNQTEKARDVVEFFCNANISSHIANIPKKIYQKLIEVLHNRMVNDESFKNDIYRCVYEYVESHKFGCKRVESFSLRFSFTHLFTSSNLNVYKRIKWLIDAPVETLMLESVILKLHEKNIDISKLKKALTYQQISNFSVASIKKIFTKEECNSMIAEILTLELQMDKLRDKLIQTDYCSAELNKKKNNGRTILYELAKKGNLICIKKLITEKLSDENISNNNLAFLLALASLYGHIECIKMVLLHKNINQIIPHNGMTALHYFGKYCRGKCVAESFNSINIDVNAIDHQKTTALHYACIYDYFEFFNMLLIHKGININIQNNKEMTALHYICLYKNIKFLKVLLTHAEIEINVKNNQEITALDYACTVDFSIGVKELLFHKKIKVNTKNKKGDTALITACKNNNPECTTELLAHKKTDVNAMNNNYQTALMLASINGNIECVKKLLADSRIDVDERDNNGDTAFHYACYYDQFECAKELLNHAIADVNVKNNYGDTALISACQKNNVECVKELLLNEETDLNTKNQRSYTALMEACDYNSTKCINELLTHGSININAKSQDGYTALIIACLNDYADCIEELLIDESTNVNEKNQNGDTALMIGCENDNVKSIKKLLDDPRINVNEKNDYDEIASLFAYLTKEERMLFDENNDAEDIKKFLTARGIEIYVKNNNGMTALHYACLNGHVECVKELLNHKKTNVNTKDKKGNTPLHYACLNGYSACVAELVANKKTNVNAENNKRKTAADYAVKNSSACLKVLFTSTKLNNESKRKHHQAFISPIYY